MWSIQIWLSDIQFNIIWIDGLVFGSNNFNTFTNWKKNNLDFDENTRMHLDFVKCECSAFLDFHRDNPIYQISIPTWTTQGIKGIYKE